MTLVNASHYELSCNAPAWSFGTYFLLISKQSTSAASLETVWLINEDWEYKSDLPRHIFLTWVLCWINTTGFGCSGNQNTAVKTQQPILWTEEVETVGLITVSQFTTGFKLCSLKKRRPAEFMWSRNSKPVPVPGPLLSGHLILNQTLF